MAAGLTEAQATTGAQNTLEHSQPVEGTQETSEQNLHSFIQRACAGGPLLAAALQRLTLQLPVVLGQAVFPQTRASLERNSEADPEEQSELTRQKGGMRDAPSE